MAQAPFMPVFTDALLGDTSHLNSEQFGSYCRILFATWRNNGIPFDDDDEAMACICHMTAKRWREKIRVKLVRFFDLSDGRWRQKRLEHEWQTVQKKIEQKRSAGNASVTAKRLNIPNTQPTDVGTAPPTTHTYTHTSPNGDDSPPMAPPEGGDADEGERDFEEWWGEYPHQVGKGAAERAWAAARLRATIAELRAGLERYKQCKPPDILWCNPGRWLREQRWLDQPDFPVRCSYGRRSAQAAELAAFDEITRH